MRIPAILKGSKSMNKTKDVDKMYITINAISLNYSTQPRIFSPHLYGEMYTVNMVL